MRIYLESQYSHILRLGVLKSETQLLLPAAWAGKGMVLPAGIYFGDDLTGQQNICLQEI